MSREISNPEMHQSEVAQEVHCRAKLPRGLIQSFGFATVGTFTLSLNSDGEILRALAPLHDALYTHLVIDNQQTLKAFAAFEDLSQDLVFPPMTKFRLEPIVHPVELEDEPWPDTARLVDVSNLPRMATYGHRSIASLEPQKGAVHAQLQFVWGPDWITANKRKHPGTNDVSQMQGIRPSKRSRTDNHSAQSPLIFKDRSNTAVEKEIEHLPKQSVASGLLDMTVTSDSESENSAMETTASNQRAVDSSHHASLADDAANIPSAQTEVRRSIGGDQQYDSLHSPDDRITAVLAASASDHGCQNRRVCTTCRANPSHPWLSTDANGTKMAKVLVQMNARLPEDAQFEYGRMYNYERCTVAKKPKDDKNAFYQKLRDFVERWDILDLHHQFAVLQWNGRTGSYRLPHFDDAILHS